MPRSSEQFKHLTRMRIPRSILHKESRWSSTDVDHACWQVWTQQTSMLLDPQKQYNVTMIARQSRHEPAQNVHRTCLIKMYELQRQVCANILVQSNIKWISFGWMFFVCLEAWLTVAVCLWIKKWQSMKEKMKLQSELKEKLWKKTEIMTIQKKCRNRIREIHSIRWIGKFCMV